jgi:DNA-binding MarR family transcriptional regulator
MGVERSLKQESQGDLRSPPLAATALQALEQVTDGLRRQIHLALRSHGMTTSQYNVLRALRNEGPNGLTCTELGNRLGGADPDITRLLDRLGKQQLVRRRRDTRDRRAVVTEITEEGAQLLSSIEPSLEERIAGLFEHIGAERLRLLIDLLEEVAHRERKPIPVHAAKAG